MEQNPPGRVMCGPATSSTGNREPRLRRAASRSLHRSTRTLPRVFDPATATSYGTASSVSPSRLATQKLCVARVDRQGRASGVTHQASVLRPELVAARSGPARRKHTSARHGVGVDARCRLLWPWAHTGFTCPMIDMRPPACANTARRPPGEHHCGDHSPTLGPSGRARHTPGLTKPRMPRLCSARCMPLIDPFAHQSHPAVQSTG